MIWRRLRANQLNGISVALGVAGVQALVAALFGLPAGLAAVGGAVGASLLDVPNAPQRVWRRLLPSAAVAAAVTLAVGLCRSQPVLMTAVVALTAFLTLMSMAWGLRAGPLSFAGILALVFAMAWSEPATPAHAFAHAGWVLLGGLLYTVWAQALARLLQARYRELALATAMRAGAQRLRSRVARIAGDPLPAGDSIRHSIADDVSLADALQAARDQVFAARSTPASRVQVDQLLGLIELRDLLLASRLDVHLLGDDAPGLQARRALGQTLLPLAETLEALADHASLGGPLPQVSAHQWREALDQRLAAVQLPEGDPREHLLQALQARLGHLLDDVAAMAARPLEADREPAFTPEQLQQFVSPEGWPLAALKAHFSLQSSVLRHALRASLAMATAYALGLWLPWAAHPHWLVLSVAVVLRGNLEQTLSRRNERIIGTVIGCLLVLALAHLPASAHGLLALVFIASVGVAHAYVNQRYRVAATAATLMALLQPLLLAPGTAPAAGERLADTLIGAGLAWAFCFVLPSWERRSLERLSAQLSGVLARHAANVLRWAPTPEQQLAQRLSRQQAYSVLALLAATAQRTRVEPAHVRLPEERLEAVLTHGYRLMALLGALQQMLNRRVQRLDAGQAAPALQQTLKACVTTLRPQAGEFAVPEDAPEALVDDWPEHEAADLTPWLLRRLRLCRREARALMEALAALQR
ncbi:FUSC family protein [Pelomonas sp. V22]|uniref:FUSC family protein n=1 Tax=Pelomonas sp. V22 TaxID=2822139 RepID=UPI0024A942D7|nr:FUSC family protein [Pelomonas sp. V22]MDI4634401.1 FUSC family protein [Pelomonas sp. V22]